MIMQCDRIASRVAFINGFDLVFERRHAWAAGGGPRRRRSGVGDAKALGAVTEACGGRRPAARTRPGRAGRVQGC